MAEKPIDFRPLRVVYSIPGMDRIQRQRDLVYKSLPAGTLLMDVYRPAPTAGKAPPAVILVHGDGPPIFVARAGLDRPGLNETLDRFTDAAMMAGLDVELHNHADGRHAFDVLDPSPRSGEIIARSVEFLKSRLLS